MCRRLVLFGLLTLASHAAMAAPCGDVYFPLTLETKPDKFKVMLAGLTGAGKSTFLDMLAGGRETSSVGSLNGQSETEDACAYHFQYLAGRYTEVQDERWMVLDTPGFDDTGGREHEITNADLVEAALRNMSEIDAVLLLWRYDEKFTATNLGGFLALRSMFDANIWKRLVLVYTHWSWDDCVSFMCDCKTQADLLSVHKATMTAMTDYIRERTGDVVCNDTVTSKCLPLPEQIPYIASDLTLDKIDRMRTFGCDPLVAPGKGDRCESMGPCPIDSPQQIRKIRDVLSNMTAVAGYERQDTSGVTNYWAACQGAHTNIQQMVDVYTNSTLRRTGKFVKETASMLQTCIQGGILSEVEEVALILEGRGDLQRHIAFFMNKTEYIVSPVFSANTLAIVTSYPDYKSYMTCMTAGDLNNQDVAVLVNAVKGCWQQLTSPAGQLLKSDYENAVVNMTSSYKKRAYSLRMAISLNMVRCPADNPACPAAEFVKQVSNSAELQELSLWSASISKGRCCALEGNLWVARPGSCDGSRMLWNQKNIGCLRSCDLTEITLPFCTVQWDGVASCKLNDAHGLSKEVRGIFRTADGIVTDAFVANGQSVALRLTDTDAFVIPTSETYQARCGEGSWQILRQWVPPAARGICDGVCKCPQKANPWQPEYCSGHKCTTKECCVTDETVSSCSRGTGGTCRVLGCHSWRDASCFRGRCVCSQGYCARDWGGDRGHCEDQCSNPADCGPDTGVECNPFDAAFGQNDCGMRNSYCKNAWCTCNPGHCAVDYGPNGYCQQKGSGQLVAQSAVSGQLAAQSTGPGRSAAHGLMAMVVAPFAAVMAATCFVLWAVQRHNVHASSEITDPLLQAQ